jgi:hypothetical protein
MPGIIVLCGRPHKTIYVTLSIMWTCQQGDGLFWGPLRSSGHA